ncbi:carboxymuconolactone decarboxylase family protein [Thioalkalivibrio sp. HK1]|uniref:carboxymuconolactone decarboxylase family protein n=1 Tax=Thioalkalivibrio sp. HK1 TaxID=1469245 RepID=UPI00046F3C95|nr:carboxymuconolactone decarboxylase family protein [Thioalkalivibrio sp. HK1]
MSLDRDRRPSRLSPVIPETATPQQRAIIDAILGGDRAQDRSMLDLVDERGGLAGPFNAWAHRPDLGEFIHRLGERLRYHGQLPAAAREIAILAVGVKWMAEFEWWAHARVARREGVDEGVLNAILAGERPSLPDPIERLAYDIAVDLLHRGRIERRAYEEALERIGESGLVELVVLVGFYCTVCFALNAFEVPLPPGEEPVFGDR